MKSYLSLIPISAKANIRRNRMTLLCIIISVFLVTTVFGMADMVIRAEKIRIVNRHGNWHIQVKDISEEAAEEIGRRSDVAAAGWHSVINIEADKAYYADSTKAALYGIDEVYLKDIMDGISEGDYPQGNHEVILSTNAKEILDIHIGGEVIINTPSGSRSYTVSGFGEDDTGMFQGQTYLIGVYMTRPAFQEILDRNRIGDAKPAYYVQFKEGTNVTDSITDIRQWYGLTDENISENTGLMGVSGFSSNSSIRNIYGLALMLFLLVVFAGVLMISGSINSNITHRTKFFGMMRCIGASRQQIIRFVRLEALNWCRTAVPAGIAASILATWGVCAALRFGIGGEFSQMPLFGLSPVGMVSGVIVGVVTVLLAAQSPAKRAANVSPAAAVSGGTESTLRVSRAADIKHIKIETLLGIHHAVSAKKNMFLMTGSFALSIILILGFGVGLDFARALLPSLRTWKPDLSIVSYGNACTLDRGIVDKIREIPGVEHVYGNVYADNIPVWSDKNTIDHVNMVSYDEYMLDCAKQSIVDGNIAEIYGDDGYALTIYNKDNPIRVGDKLRIGNAEIEIAGALSDGLFADDSIIICSEGTFGSLMGEQNYAMISVQLEDDATEETVKGILTFTGENDIFSDMRDSNRETNATYWATRLLGYSFLTIIGMITVLYIVNSISMSAFARIRQYGAMRAVGMDGRQLTKMIAAEAFTYAASGWGAGLALGLPLSRLLYLGLITKYFGREWRIPAAQLGFILLLVAAAAAAAVYIPSKRIRDMAVTDTINEL